MKTNSLATIIAFSEADIIKALQTAETSKCSVHCYSAGFNWGYGASDSVDPEAIHLDLSQMNKIISFDPVLGILRIQPGVTQGQLYDFLKSHNYEYYVPNTGAGKRGSILGNALERGFGIAPIHDHASSITSVRGLLADGSLYESALNEIDPKLADCFTWGVGPQLDKMVSQSSWLIITEVSLQLKKKHARTDVLIVSFANEEFKNITAALQDLLSLDDGSIGSIKIFNKKQILTKEMETEGNRFFKNNEWFMSLIIYSHPITRCSIIKYVKTKLATYTNERLTILNKRKVNFLIKILTPFPTLKTIHLLHKLKDLREMIKLAEGEVSEVGYKALNINFNYEAEKLFTISKFNKELAWLSPLCPLDGNRATELLSLIKKINTHHEFQFNTYTWTILNQRTLALVIPILFDKDKKDEFFEWYKAIHLELKKEGFIPYRFHIRMMDFVRENLLPQYFKHVDKFEKAFDPKGIILKGRY